MKVSPGCISARNTACSSACRSWAARWRSRSRTVSWRARSHRSRPRPAPPSPGDPGPPGMAARPFARYCARPTTSATPRPIPSTLLAESRPDDVPRDPRVGSASVVNKRCPSRRRLSVGGHRGVPETCYLSNPYLRRDEALSTARRDTISNPKRAKASDVDGQTPASLIGRLGSSAFRLSTTAVSMSLTGSRFSSESAPRPFHHGIRGRGGTI